MKRKRAKTKTPAVRIRSSSAPGWLHLVVLAGLLLGNLLIYQQTFHLGFFSLDDPDYVVNNPYIETLNWANLARILTAPYFANFSPLHILSYMADVLAAGGKNAFTFHLSNVLWNGFAVCMVYLLAYTIRSHVPMAAAASLLFLVHPAHVEVVAWISSRKDLVATGFGVLTMIVYLLYRRQEKRPQWVYAGSLFCFFLATAGKQSVVLLPAVMLGWDFFVEKRRGWAMVLDKIPFGLITVLFALPTMGAQPDTQRSYELTVLASNQIWNGWLLTGLGKYVIYRPTLETASLPLIGHLLVIGLVAAAWIGPVLCYKYLNPVRLMLWYWVLIQLIPPMVFSFITPITDRYLFLPSVGFCLLVADLITHPATGTPGRVRGRWIALAGLTAIWTYQTWTYLGEWKDPRSVWYAATTKSRAYQNNEYLGRIYQEAGDRINQFLTSNSKPDLDRELPLAEAVLGDPAAVATLKTEWEGKIQTKTHSQSYRDQLWDLAWQQFELAVARRGTVNTPNLYQRRGMILVNQGKFQEAIAEFQQALRLARTHTFARIRTENVTHITRAMGIAYWRLRNYAEARRWFLEAQRTQRASGQVWIPTLDQEVEQISRLAGNQPVRPSAP